MSTVKRVYNLEKRLIEFSSLCLKVCDKLPRTRVGLNLEHQLSKSATAPALLYGEAQAAESRSDFIHKMSIALKELRETQINLQIILHKPVLSDEMVNLACKEVSELIAIFASSIQTAKRNKRIK